MKKTEKKKATTAATPKTKRSGTANSKSISSKDSVDLAMVQIAERVLESPTDNKSEDDENSLFGRIIAKRMKKLAPKTKGFVTQYIEQLLFQSEFGTGKTQGHEAPGMGFNPINYTHQYQHSQYTDYQNSNQTFSRQLHQYS